MSPTDFHSEAIRRFFSQERGTIVLVGGNESKSDDMGPLKKFVDLSGGSKANIAVITSASSEPEEMGDVYKEAFTYFGAEHVEIMDIRNRDDANDPENMKIIKDATGVFFTGGSQLRLSSILGGTITFYSILDHHNNGGVIAGTSAGASCMATTMIKSGPGTESFVKGFVQFGPGLGFLPNIVIDTHFTQRGRIGRLIHAITENPGIMGIGLDENTGMVVYSDGMARVIGEGTVTIVDGHMIKSTNVYDIEEGFPISVSPIKVHIISDKHWYDIVKCRFVDPTSRD